MDKTKEQQAIGPEEQSSQQQEPNGEILEEPKERQMVGSEEQSSQQQELSEEDLEAATGGWLDQLLTGIDGIRLANKAYWFGKKHL